MLTTPTQTNYTPEHRINHLELVKEDKTDRYYKGENNKSIILFPSYSTKSIRDQLNVAVLDVMDESGDRLFTVYPNVRIVEVIPNCKILQLIQGVYIEDEIVDMAFESDTVEQFTTGSYDPYDIIKQYRDLGVNTLKPVHRPISLKSGTTAFSVPDFWKNTVPHVAILVPENSEEKDICN